MKDREFHLHDGQMGAAITVRVTPRSIRNEVSEILDDGTVKIRLTATQPVEKMNQALVAYLAEILGIQPAKIEIVAGVSGNDKLITITDLNSQMVHERILSKIA